MAIMYQYISPWHRYPLIPPRRPREASEYPTGMRLTIIKQHFRGLITWVMSKSGSATKKHQVWDFGILSKLPREILLYIRFFLPCHAVSALALCNSSFYELLANDALNQLRHDRDQKRLLVFLLERNLPISWLSCARCSKLHLPASGNLHSTYDEKLDLGLRYRIAKRPCQEDDIARGARHYFHPWLRFEKVQMLMKLHRAGLHTAKNLEGINYCGPCVFPKNLIVDFKARINDSNLLCRRQDWYLFPTLPKIGMSLWDFVPPCAHFDDDMKARKWWGEQMRDVVQSLQKLGTEEPERIFSLQTWTKTQIFRCIFCTVDFQIGFGQLQRKRSEGIFSPAIVVSKWMCLGKGTSPAEQDWQGHLHDDYFLHGNSFLRGNRLRDRQIQLDRRRGSIREAYEGDEMFAESLQPV